MKLGLIKKSMICVLAASFSLVLASCALKPASKKNNSDITNTTNVFSKKDILAYAKKEIGSKPTYKEIELVKLDQDKYYVDSNDYGYDCGYYKDYDTEKWYLYSQITGKTYEIPTESGEEIEFVSETGDLGSSFNPTYGYFYIGFDSGKQMLIDYNGDVVVAKDEISGIQVNAISSRLIKDDYDYVGDLTFYDFISIRHGSDYTYETYKIDAKIAKGMVVTEFTRTKLAADEEVDYDNYDLNNISHVYKLENYDLYFEGSYYYLSDLDGKIINSGNLSLPTNTRWFTLGDKLFYQTTTTVTDRADEYTYEDSGSFYKLDTYSLDLKTGTTTELKDFGYKLSTTSAYTLRYISGYNEKKDRFYLAACYTGLNRIVNKTLSKVTTEVMMDASGKILSDKIGEVGHNVYAFDDKTFAVYTSKYYSLINTSGKVLKTIKRSNSMYVNYDSKVFLRPTYYGGYTGYFVNFDDELIADQGNGYNLVTTNEGNIAYFDNYNVFVTHNGVTELVSMTDNSILALAHFDKCRTTIGLQSLKEGEKCVIFDGNLLFDNIYLVQTKKETNSTIEIYAYDGTLLDTIEDVTYISYTSDYATFGLSISTTTTSYRFAVNRIY